MDKVLINNPTDLILDRCPLGCNKTCTGVWINEITKYRIICKCECEHKETLARVWDPEANAIAESSSSSEETKENED